MDVRTFDRFAQKMRRKISGMVGRAVLTAVDDSMGIQSMQIEGLADEAHDGVERMQDYGFTSHPFAEAEAVVVFATGLRSHGLVVAVGDRRYRLKGTEPGEVAMYDDQGQVIHLKRDGILVHTDKKLTIEAGEELLIKGEATLNVVAASAMLLKSETSVTIEAPTVTIDSDDVKLAGDGPAVARVGDPVSSGGFIEQGSTKVTAA